MGSWENTQQSIFLNLTTAMAHFFWFAHGEPIGARIDISIIHKERKMKKVEKIRYRLTNACLSSLLN